MDSRLKGKNVLVTGGTGLVGSHIVERLINLGANVFVVDLVVRPGSYFESQKLQK
jgi:nucleoside-diphosphate-sugar epimerase